MTVTTEPIKSLAISALDEVRGLDSDHSSEDLGSSLCVSVILRSSSKLFTGCAEASALQFDGSSELSFTSVANTTRHHFKQRIRD